MTNRRISERAEEIVKSTDAIYSYEDGKVIALNEAADALDNIADTVPIGGATASDFLLAQWARETILPTLADVGYWQQY